jgi:hypothetical protein
MHLRRFNASFTAKYLYLLAYGLLELRHVFLHGRFFRERPGQHEFGLEYGLCTLNPSIQRSRHPAQHGVADVALDILEDLPGPGLVPSPIEVLRYCAKLDQEIPG